VVEVTIYLIGLNQNKGGMISRPLLVFFWKILTVKHCSLLITFLYSQLKPRDKAIARMSNNTERDWGFSVCGQSGYIFC
ncbi:MAG: hypothetical protein MPJ25_14040, partial [Pirellulales bacterium]|nr:hypothetical protein [Pirellulales bacterium]